MLYLTLLNTTNEHFTLVMLLNDSEIVEYCAPTQNSRMFIIRGRNILRRIIIIEGHSTTLRLTFTVGYNYPYGSESEHPVLNISTVRCRYPVRRTKKQFSTPGSFLRLGFTSARNLHNKAQNSTTLEQLQPEEAHRKEERH